MRSVGGGKDLEAAAGARRCGGYRALGAPLAFGEYGAMNRSADGNRSQTGTNGQLRAGLIESGSGNLIVVGRTGQSCARRMAGDRGTN